MRQWTAHDLNSCRRYMSFRAFHFHNSICIYIYKYIYIYLRHNPDSKVLGANMGTTRADRPQVGCWPHVLLSGKSLAKTHGETRDTLLYQDKLFIIASNSQTRICFIRLLLSGYGVLNYHSISPLHLLKYSRQPEREMRSYFVLLLDPNVTHSLWCFFCHLKCISII